MPLDEDIIWITHKQNGWAPLKEAVQYAMELESTEITDKQLKHHPEIM